MLTCVLRT